MQIMNYPLRFLVLEPGCLRKGEKLLGRRGVQGRLHSQIELCLLRIWDGQGTGHGHPASIDHGKLGFLIHFRVCTKDL